MAGRGFSFRIPKKPEDRQLEEDLADVPPSTTRSESIPPPSVSSAMFLPTFGRGTGRGMAYVQLPKNGMTDDQRSDATSAGPPSTLLSIGRGVTMMGRGIFANRPVTTEITGVGSSEESTVVTGVSSSDPIEPGSSGSREVSGGIITGRGTSGRGTGQGTSGRGSGGESLIFWKFSINLSYFPGVFGSGESPLPSGEASKSYPSVRPPSSNSLGKLNI